MIWLKQSTSVVISMGPFLDMTDGNTLETGLVSALDHATTGIKLCKNGGTATVRSATVTASTYDGSGIYKVTFSTTDTNTLGSLKIVYADNGVTCLPLWEDAMVLPSNVWDALFGSDKLMVDAVEINSIAASAARLALSAGVIIPGTVDTASFTATTTEFEADDITDAAADFYNGRVIIFTSGALLAQAKSILDYSKIGANGHFTVNALTSAPANNVTFVIL